MKKKIFKSLVALFLLGSTLSVASCGNRTEPTSGGDATTNTPTSSSEPQSVIKSLTAKSEEVELRVEESKKIEAYYDIKGYAALNNKQKACTVTSSNEKVVKFSSNKKNMIGVSVGDAIITVTSSVDTTKFCSFKVVVKDVYFNHTTSTIQEDDDFSKELKDDGGIVETSAKMSGDYFIKGIDSKTWMAEVEVTVKEISKDEKYPKFGIVASTEGNANSDGSGENRVYFFLDGAIGDEENYSWRNFGFCEVFNQGSWAWNPGVTNAIARHADACYSLPEGKIITPTSKLQEGSTATATFKMKVAHDGYDFHMWINDNYAASMKVLPYLFQDNAGNVVNSTCGFFQFNSDVVYQNYSATQDATVVQEAINSIENVRFLADSDWAAD